MASPLDLMANSRVARPVAALQIRTRPSPGVQRAIRSPSGEKVARHRLFVIRLSVKVAGNVIQDNAGPGIFVDAGPKNGLPVLASGIELTSNHVLGNARHARAALRGGIVIAGGQDDGSGHAAPFSGPSRIRSRSLGHAPKIWLCHPVACGDSRSCQSIKHWAGACDNF